ncbi:MAG: hypothetical protein PHU63_01815 [Candidatus ainarchaeum sp.]|nr:hypothetical protein [Candidatus ainarchaeum sp.]
MSTVKKTKNIKNKEKQSKSISTQKDKKETNPLAQKIRAEMEEINKFFSTISFYPVAVNLEKKEEARQGILKKYSEGEEYIKQNILHLIYETVTQYSEYKYPMNYGFFKSKNPQEPPEKLRFAVYKTMFNYHSSMEGTLEMIDLLREFGDVSSAKLLSHLFNYFSSNDSERFRLLRNAVIESLGAHDSVYALQVLLSYVKIIDSEKLFHRIFISLNAWNEKLDSLPLAPDEKRRLKSSLEDVLENKNDENNSAYVR